MTLIRCGLIVVLAFVLTACDSSNGDASGTEGHYAATVTGSYTATLDGTALFRANETTPGVFTPLPVPPLPGDSLAPKDSLVGGYSLVLAPGPATATAFPGFLFALPDAAFEARALVFTPQDDQPFNFQGLFFPDGNFTTGPWHADSGRVVLETVTEEQVTGSFDVRFARLDRMTYDPVFAEATGTFEALVVRAP